MAVIGKAGCFAVLGWIFAAMAPLARRPQLPDLRPMARDVAEQRRVGVHRPTSRKGER